MAKQKAGTIGDDYYSEVVANCSKLVASADISAWKRIEANFAIGLQVEKLASDARYGDGIVTQLARDISLSRKKQIFESTLYECRIVANYFNGKLSGVKKLYDASSTNVTWASLVTGVRKEKEQKELQKKAETRNPEHIIFANQVKNGLLKLCRYVNNEEITQEVRQEIEIDMGHIFRLSSNISQALAEEKNSRQVNLFTHELDGASLNF